MHSYPIPNSIASTFGLTTCGLVFIPNIPVCIPFYVSPYIHSHPIKPLVFLAKSSLNVAAGAGSVYIPAYTYIYILFFHSCLVSYDHPLLSYDNPFPIYICIYIYIYMRVCIIYLYIYICVYKLYLIYFDIIHLYIYHIYIYIYIYIPAWSATTIPSYIYTYKYLSIHIFSFPPGQRRPSSHGGDSST